MNMNDSQAAASAAAAGVHSLPRELAYPAALSSFYGAKVDRNVALPQNGASFSGNSSSRMIFQIPSADANAFLNGNDTYLVFKMAATAYAAYLARSANAAISRLEIKVGSNTIEDCIGYGEIVNDLLPYYYNQGDLNSLMQYSGTDPDSVLPAWTALANNTATTIDAAVTSLVGDINNELRGKLGIGASVTTTGVYFAIPLMSSVIGNLMKGYWPLGFHAGQPITVSIYLQDYTSVLNTNAANPATGYTISEAKLVYTTVSISDQALTALTASLPPVVQVPVTQWRQAQTGFTITDAASAVTSQLNLLIPGCKFFSLRGLYWTFRPDSCLTTGGTSAAARILAGTSSWQYVINGKRYPSQAIVSDSGTNNAEFMAEILRTLGSLQDTSRKCAVSTTNFTTNSLVTTAHVHQAGLQGLDMSMYPDMDSSRNLCGVDTSTSDLFLATNYTVAANGVAAGVKQMTAMFLYNFDAVFVFDRVARTVLVRC